MKSLPFVTLLLAVLAGIGCKTNYSFQQALAGGPAYDAGKLRADLGAQESLREASWVPLVSLATTKFAPSAGEGVPDGFKLSEIHFRGPLFAFLERSEQRFGPGGEWFETVEHRSFLWGLWGRQHSHVLTGRGVREETSSYLLGFLRSRPESRYVPAGTAQ